MRTVSPEFLAAVGGSYRVAIIARSHTPDGVATDLEVVDGSVTLDWNAASRGSLDLTVQGKDWVPADPYGSLSPYGTEIEIRRGLYLPDGTVETVPLGWFGIEACDVVDTGAGLETRVTGLDRSARLIRALVEQDQQFTAGTPIVDAIVALARDAWADVPISPLFATVTDVGWPGPNPAQSFAGNDRWVDMTDAAKILEHTIFFDGDGVLTPRQYAEQSPVLEVVEGEGGVLIEASRSWSRAEAFNKVIATGESTDGEEAYRAEAVDDDPASPTYYYGPFGQCPYFYSDSNIQSDAAAQSVANNLLQQQMGVAASVNFSMVPNPALEPGDSVVIRRERAGINETHVVDQISIGLGADAAMSCQTRQRRIQ